MEIQGNEYEETQLDKSAFCVILEDAIKDYNEEPCYDKLETLFRTLVYGCIHKEKIIAAAGFDQKIDISNSDNIPEELTGLHLRYLVTENREAFAVIYTFIDMYQYCPTDSMVEMYLYDVFIRVSKQKAVKALVINPNSDICYVAEREFIQAVLDSVKDNISE